MITNVKDNDIVVLESTCAYLQKKYAVTALDEIRIYAKREATSECVASNRSLIVNIYKS